jgi:hypothetical protein
LHSFFSPRAVALFPGQAAYPAFPVNYAYDQGCCCAVA